MPPSWTTLNQLFDTWQKKYLAIPVALLMIIVTLGLSVPADWQANQSWLPCALKREQKIREPIGVVVANVAIRSTAGRAPTKDETANAEVINQSLYDQVIDRMSMPGTVGVGRPCKKKIQSAIGREEYLAKERELLDGELAISAIITPAGRRFTREIELSIGSTEDWNEAQEFAGYYPFPGGDIGASLSVRDGLATKSVAELLGPYIDMLRAVAAYAIPDYDKTLDTLDDVLRASNLPSKLAQLAYVLKGNAEGRQARPGFLDRSEAAYKHAESLAQSVGGDYPRATLGLAEIDYQRGLLQIAPTARGAKCEGTLTSDAKAHIDAAYAKYSKVFAASSTSEVPDVDVRAKYGTGRIHACLARLGYEDHIEKAVRDLLFVTNGFMAAKTKTWLRSPASGAFGELGLIYCQQGRRDDAIAAYDDAFEWAVDEARGDMYREALSTIRADASACL